MNSKKIFIIDDDIAILDSLGTILDFEGFEVNTFVRGSEIFKFVDKISKPNLILLDMWLCDEDGLSLIHIQMCIRDSSDIENYPFYDAKNIHILDRNNLKIEAGFFQTPFQKLDSEILEKMSLDSFISCLFIEHQDNFWQISKR